jgi:hypothetical protein
MSLMSYAPPSPAAVHFPRYPIPPKSPPISDQLDFSRVIYPDPPSHDFLTFLVVAEAMRRWSGSEQPLRVTLALYEGMLGKFDFSAWSLRAGKNYACGRDRAYSVKMIQNVLRPAMAMMGAAETFPVELTLLTSLDFLAGTVEYDHHVSGLVDAVRAGTIGSDLPRWQPPKWAVDEVEERLSGSRPIVITLREEHWQPERNSRVHDWWRFVQDIGRLYDVIIVRDTAMSASTDGALAHRAATNAFVRCALYQRALATLATCTGPIGWFQYSSPAPYLIFKQLVPSIPGWEHGQAEGWRRQASMEVGQDYPWAGEHQHLTWVDDTYSNIREWFERIEPALR